MERTIVITGGTRGIGRALAHQRLAAGDTVVAVGSTAAGGERFQVETAAHGGRAQFLLTDLSTVAATREVAARIAAAHPRIDALVLGANRMYPRRAETSEGLEATFALYYLSRYVLATALRDELERAERPIVINLAGPGITAGAVQWDDVRLVDRWTSMRAQLQAGRANDLLGRILAMAGGPIRSIVYNPGFADTRPYPGIRQPWRMLAEVAAAIAAAPPERVATAITELIDTPPPPGFTAVQRKGTRNHPIDTGLRTFEPADAARLDALTKELLPS